MAENGVVTPTYSMTSAQAIVSRRRLILGALRS
jgi:hypothetical protein